MLLEYSEVLSILPLDTVQDSATGFTEWVSRIRWTDWRSFWCYRKELCGLLYAALLLYFSRLLSCLPWAESYLLLYQYSLDFSCHGSAMTYFWFNFLFCCWSNIFGFYLEKSNFPLGRFSCSVQTFMGLFRFGLCTWACFHMIFWFSSKNYYSFFDL